jgi:hypothetical protein
MADQRASCPVGHAQVQTVPGKYAKAMAWLQKVYQYQPRLFARWQLIAFTLAGLWGRMTGDRHVRS